MKKQSKSPDPGDYFELEAFVSGPCSWAMGLGGGVEAQAQPLQCRDQLWRRRGPRTGETELHSSETRRGCGGGGAADSGARGSRPATRRPVITAAPNGRRCLREM